MSATTKLTNIPIISPDQNVYVLYTEHIALCTYTTAFITTHFIHINNTKIYFSSYKIISKNDYDNKQFFFCSCVVVLVCYQQNKIENNNNHTGIFVVAADFM